ncbi:hypothetical protein ONA24_06175 [Mycoplasmopsis cynos]|nr:hypothetical protein [Mycoplasmopsis cynos]WAM09547.1 hypothetical protein ONA24_06175 [Mycoplasmopsis cynos]
MNLKNIENKKTRFVGIYEKAINNKFNWDEKIKIAKNLQVLILLNSV